MLFYVIIIENSFNNNNNIQNKASLTKGSVAHVPVVRWLNVQQQQQQQQQQQKRRREMWLM